MHSELQRHITPATREQRFELRFAQPAEQLVAQASRIDDEAQDGEVLEPARIVPEQPQEHRMPCLWSDTLRGHVDLLCRRVTARELDHGAPERRIALESAVATVKHHFACARLLALRVPDEEAVHMRIRLESLFVLLRDEIEPPGAEIRVIDGRQGVEDRAVERAPQFRRDVGGGLLADLVQDHFSLRLQRRQHVAHTDLGGIDLVDEDDVGNVVVFDELQQRRQRPRRARARVRRPARPRRSRRAPQKGIVLELDRARNVEEGPLVAEIVDRGNVHLGAHAALARLGQHRRRSRCLRASSRAGRWPP